MRLLKVAIISLLLGCNAGGGGLTASPQQDAQHITYVKDQRTGLCFVYNIVQDDHMFNWPVLTNVPCSPEVEKLITK